MIVTEFMEGGSLDRFLKVCLIFWSGKAGDLPAIDCHWGGACTLFKLL